MVRYSKALAEALREAIGDRKQADIARSIRRDTATLSRIVRHGRVPSPELLAEVADALELQGAARRKLFAAAGYVELAPEAVA